MRPQRTLLTPLRTTGTSGSPSPSSSNHCTSWNHCGASLSAHGHFSFSGASPPTWLGPCASCNGSGSAWHAAKLRQPGAELCTWPSWRTCINCGHCGSSGSWWRPAPAGCHHSGGCLPAEIQECAPDCTRDHAEQLRHHAQARTPTLSADDSPGWQAVFSDAAVALPKLEMSIRRAPCMPAIYWPCVSCSPLHPMQRAPGLLAGSMW